MKWSTRLLISPCFWRMSHKCASIAPLLAYSVCVLQVTRSTLQTILQVTKAAESHLMLATKECSYYRKQCSECKTSLHAMFTDNEVFLLVRQDSGILLTRGARHGVPKAWWVAWSQTPVTTCWGDQPPPLKKPRQCSHCHKSDVTTKEYAPILNRLWLLLFQYPCHNLTSRTQVLLLWPVLQQETLTESLDSAELTSFYSGFQDYSLHKNTPISLHPRIQECSPALPRYTR